MSVYESLMAIQAELKAPKGQYNSFGKYNYRNCEDILEAAKPLLKAHNCVLTLSDEIIAIGDRVYVKATACLTCVAAVETQYSVSAFARESLDKKGMDDSQITGAASSYARKYALNGLFCIDDNKDADSTDNTGEITGKTLDLAKVEKAVKWFHGAIEADKDEDEMAPKIKEQYNKLTNDEQIEVNNKLKSIKVEGRQCNTLLKAFLDWKPAEI